MYTEMKPIKETRICDEVMPPEYYNCADIKKDPDPSFDGGIQVIDCPAYGTSLDCKLDNTSSTSSPENCEDYTKDDQCTKTE